MQFVYYCRSTLASVRNAEVSGHVLNLAGLETRVLHSDDFPRFAALLQLCPEQDREGSHVRAISIYYALLRVLAGILSLAPRVSSWIRREQQACAHFAAVVLDRRISSSRNLLLQRAVNRP